MRMCVDYRQLNAKTRKDLFPLPRTEKSLDLLSEARWFSTSDLASGYNQVEVVEKDHCKTAFCTPFGLYEFNRMAFGLCNALGTFQRLMERILGDFLGHVISAEGVATDPMKIRAVAEWWQLQDLQELKSFLGFASFYWCFVKNFASIAAPLYALCTLGNVKSGAKLSPAIFQQQWSVTRLSGGCERS